MTSLDYYLQTIRSSLRSDQVFFTLSSTRYTSPLPTQIDYLFLDSNWYTNEHIDVTKLVSVSKHIIVKDTNQGLSRDLYQLLNSECHTWKMVKNNPFEGYGWSAFQR